MSQGAYNVNMDEAFIGMKADSGFDDVISLQATEIISFGLGVVKNIGHDLQCRLPAANEGVLVFDADLVTSNTIDMDVNGVAMTQVTFSGTHAATMALIIIQLELFDDVLSAALDPDDTDNRTLIIKTNDEEDLAITSIVVAAGGSQAGGVFTAGTRDILVGMSLATHAKEQARTTGIVQYEDTEPVSVLHEGRGWVYAEEAVTSDDPVYCRFLANGTGKAPGQFRNDADSGKCLLVSNAKFVSTASGAGPVKVEFDR